MSDSLSRIGRHRLLELQTRFVELLRTTLGYLGVAAMVTVLMIASVPTLRGQATVLHEAALSAMVTGDQEIEPRLLIDPVAVAPQANPVDLRRVPAKVLAPKSDSDKIGSATVEMTEAMGLLGNNQVDLIKASMNYFGITKEQRDALESYIARKFWVGKSVIHRLTETVFIVAHEYDVHPLLLLALMSVESRFNPYAESGAGAQGLMQVMTRVHKDKFEKLGQEEDAAFHPQHNIWVGTQILRDCIKRRGSITNGLKCYVGASGSDDGGYSNKVLAEQRRMAIAAKVALQR